MPFQVVLVNKCSKPEALCICARDMVKHSKNICIPDWKGCLDCRQLQQF